MCQSLRYVHGITWFFWRDPIETKLETSYCLSYNLAFSGIAAASAFALAFKSFLRIFPDGLRCFNSGLIIIRFRVRHAGVKLTI